MKLYRMGALAAGFVAAAIALSPAAAMAGGHHHGSTTTNTRMTACTLGGQYSSGTNVGLVNLNNLDLGVLTHPAVGILGIAGTSNDQTVSCGNS